MTRNHTVHDQTDGYVTVSCDCGWAVQRPAGGPAKFAKSRHRCGGWLKRKAEAEAVAARKAARDAIPHTCPPAHRDKASGYTVHKCRAAGCRAAHTAKETARQRTAAYGRATTDLVDATPARTRLLWLEQQGVGQRTVRDHTGIATSTLRRIRQGRARVTPATLNAILAVPVELAPRALTNPTGTARRLQALAHAGWSLTALESRLGFSRWSLQKILTGGGVTKDTADRIADVYPAVLKAQPPHATRQERRAVTLAKKRAIAHDWQPDIAWDDIDNDGAPATVNPTPHKDRYAHLVEDVAFLAATGETWDAITKRTGRTQEAITTNLRRAGRTDITRTIHLTTHGPDNPISKAEARGKAAA